MQLGYSINSAQPSSKPAAQIAGKLIERARIASAVGYDYIQAGDHHTVENGQYFQNIPTLARIAATSEYIAPLFLLPLHHPIHIAEQCGTLGAFTDHFDFWCALGYEESSFAAFDVPMSERASRFEEALEIITRLWNEPSVTYQGKFYSFNEVSIGPTIQPDRICIGGSAQPAVKRAGQLGDAWVASPSEPIESLETKRDWFEEAGGGEIIARRDALVLEDQDKAESIARGMLEKGYRGWNSNAPWLLVGDAETVVTDLRLLADVGVSDVTIRPMSDKYAEHTLRQVSKARSLM